MSWTKNGTCICERCGRFCIPADSLTTFGGQGADGLEPHDPEFYCKKCAEWLAVKWDRYFKFGGYSGDYHKSNAEVKAAKKYNLTWVNSAGKYGTSEFVLYRYLSNSDCRLKQEPAPNKA